MPLVHIHLREGKSSDYLDALSQSVYRALVRALTSRENPQIGNFQTISQYKSNCLIYDEKIFGVNDLKRRFSFASRRLKFHQK